MDSDSSSKFIASLTKFLQSLCNGYVEFQNGVELAGHIYLSIDTGEKIDYILHEKVCKNDENSVTFVSNSFHAQPPADKKKENKQQSEVSKGTRSKEPSREEDDVVIIDQDNEDTRGMKRAASPSSEQRHRPLGPRNLPGSAMRQGPRGSRQQPSATVTSQDGQQGDGFDAGDVKLEQMTTDELLSLASQVSDSSGGPSHRTAASHPHPPPRLRGAKGDAPPEMWIKQEIDDADVPGGSDSGQSWPHGRDDSNSGPGGSLYPVMLHQNTAAFSPSTSGFPVFPGMGGPSATATSQLPGLGQPLSSSAQSSANPYANPIPGTSQGTGAVDPAEPRSPGLQPVVAQLARSNKGKRCLVLNGYKYRVNNLLRNGDLSWRCNHKKCKASVRTSGSGSFVTEIIGNGHNHLPTERIPA